MRYLLAPAILLLFSAASAAAHYPADVGEIYVNAMKLNTSLINTTYISEQLWFFSGNITLNTTNTIPRDIEGYLEGHKIGTGNESCYRWEDLAVIGERLGFFKPGALNVVLVANLPCRNNPLGCFCAAQENLTSAYIDQNLAMVEIDSMLANASEAGSIVSSVVVEAAKDAAYPPLERLGLEQAPMMLGSHLHLIFLECRAGADITEAVSELMESVPEDIMVTYEERQCSDVDYGNIATADDIGEYVYSEPSLFGLDSYADTGKLPIVLIRGDPFETVTPFFAIKSGQEEFSGADIVPLLARHLGLSSGMNPESAANGADHFSAIDIAKLRLILSDFRRDVAARDALLRIGLMYRLNTSLTYERTGSLDFYPGFEEAYASLLREFKLGLYADVLNQSKELLSEFRQQGYWNSWAEDVKLQVDGIEGDANCEACGSGCYGFDGICCGAAFHAGGNCCGNDCPAGFTCSGNVCSFDWWLLARSTFYATILVVPPFAAVVLALVSIRKLRQFRIRAGYRKLRADGLKEDRIYFRLFQMGYKKKDIEEVLGSGDKGDKPKKGA